MHTALARLCTQLLQAMCDSSRPVVFGQKVFEALPEAPLRRYGNSIPCSDPEHGTLHVKPHQLHPQQLSNKGEPAGPPAVSGSRGQSSYRQSLVAAT